MTIFILGLSTRAPSMPMAGAAMKRFEPQCGAAMPMAGGAAMKRFEPQCGASMPMPKSGKMTQLSPTGLQQTPPNKKRNIFNGLRNTLRFNEPEKRRKNDNKRKYYC